MRFSFHARDSSNVNLERPALIKHVARGYGRSKPCARNVLRLIEHAQRLERFNLKLVGEIWLESLVQELEKRGALID